jgi:hypothetical protein
MSNLSTIEERTEATSTVATLSSEPEPATTISQLTIPSGFTQDNLAPPEPSAYFGSSQGSRSATLEESALEESALQNGDAGNSPRGGGSSRPTDLAPFAEEEPSSAADASRKRRWLIPILLFVLVAIIIAIVIPVAVSSSDSRSSNAGSLQDGDNTPTTTTPTRSPVALPPFNAPATAPTVVDPTPTANPFSSTGTDRGEPTDGGAGEPDDNSEVPGGDGGIVNGSCPSRPLNNPTLPGSTDGTLSVLHQLVWGGLTSYGECAEVSHRLRAGCRNGGRILLLSSPDADCSLDAEDTIVCENAGNGRNRIDVVCYGTSTEQVNVWMDLLKGTTECSTFHLFFANNEYRGYVTASYQCREDRRQAIECSVGAEVVEVNSVNYCDSVDRCQRLINPCTVSFEVSLDSYVETECVDTFSLTRPEGEPCLKNVMCASEVCVNGICRSGPGCAEADCEVNSHCQSTSCSDGFCL